MCHWLLENQAEMEPRWSVTNIRLIVLDEFLTDNLLAQLGITHRCVLRGNYYHLINEIWPQEINFGKIISKP